MNTQLAISCGFIGFCCLLAAIARIIVSRTVNSCLVKELLYEAIAAAELCACCFELIIGECDRQTNNPVFKLILWLFFSHFLRCHCLAADMMLLLLLMLRWLLFRWFLCCVLSSGTLFGTAFLMPLKCKPIDIVADNFGIAVYAICLFFLTILWSMVWGDATACPYTHMEDWLEGKTSLRLVILKTWAQVMGGCCVYRFVQIFWWLEIAQTHEGRAFESCTTDLQVSKDKYVQAHTKYHSIFTNVNIRSNERKYNPAKFHISCSIVNVVVVVVIFGFRFVILGERIFGSIH